LDANLSRTLIRFVLTDVFTLQFEIDASFFRLSEYFGAGFGGCGTGSHS
jgi:hypothetical protein